MSRVMESCLGAMVIAVSIAGVVIGQQHQTIVSQKAQIVTQRGCVSALVMPGAGDTKACEPALVDLVNDGRKARACEAAVEAGNLSPACTLYVQAAVIERAQLREQVTQLQADSSAAILRAETRARQSEQRKTQNARVLQAAPRDGDGLIVCDALCLRQRAEGNGPGN